MRSLRMCLRSLWRTPVVSLAVILSLGLGIGTNTAIFSLVHQVLLRQLPVEHPEQLAALHSPKKFRSGRVAPGGSGGKDAIFSYPVLRRLEQQADRRAVQGVAGYRAVEANLAYRGQTVYGSAVLVSGGYFPILGVRPMLGRTLTWEDDRGAGHTVVVLSYGYWKSRLGGAPEVLNQPLRINGQVYSIVGVLPEGFTSFSFHENPNVYVPMTFKAAVTPGWDGRDRWDDYWIYLFARLAPGVTADRGLAALNSSYAGIVQEEAPTVAENHYPAFVKQFLASRLWLSPAAAGQSPEPAQMRAPLTILMVATALVLLIAAGNAANLLLSRALRRAREMAIRTALGASRGQLFRQLLAEALLLSAAGCVTGLLLGAWTLHLLIANAPADMSAFLDPALEPPVLLFSIALSVSIGLLFGSYPAWAGTRSGVSSALKKQSSQATASLPGVHVRRLLVVGQVTLSLVLLIPMGLLLQSFVKLVHSNIGVNRDHLLTFTLSPDLNGYTPARSRVLFERVEQELAAIRGIRGVADSTIPIIDGGSWCTNVQLPGHRSEVVFFNEVGGAFFGTMGIPLVAGRELTAAEAAPATVVNEAFVRQYLKGVNPIGYRLMSNLGRVEREIVGVVKDSKYGDVRETAPATFFVPYRQIPDLGPMTFYVRTALAPEQVMPAIRHAVRRLDPDLPLVGLKTFDDQIGQSVGTERLLTQLASAFAILATFLAMLGLYGVTAYGVGRRRHEFGIRVALGAASGDIGRLVLHEVAWILGIGITVGVPVAIAVSRYTESQLYGVKPFDPWVTAAAIASLALAGLVAGYLPARTASRLDPQQALRDE